MITDEEFSNLVKKADEILEAEKQREFERQEEMLRNSFQEAVANYEEGKELLEKINTGELFSTEGCTPKKAEAIQKQAKKLKEKAQKQIDASLEKIKECKEKTEEIHKKQAYKQSSPKQDEQKRYNPLSRIKQTMTGFLEKSKAFVNACREAIFNQNEALKKLKEGYITRKEYLADKQKIRTSYKAHKLAFEQKTYVAEVNLNETRDKLKATEEDLNRALQKANTAQEKGLAAREKEYYKAQMKECFLHLIHRGRTNDGLISPEEFDMSPKGEYAEKINMEFENVLNAKERVEALKNELMEQEKEKFRTDSEYEFILKPEGMSERNFNKATANLRNAIRDTASLDLVWYVNERDDDGIGFAYDIDQITQIDRMLNSENISTETRDYIADKTLEAEKMSGLIALANRGIDVTQFDKEVVREMDIEDFNKECEFALEEHLNSKEYLAQLAENYGIPLGTEQEKITILKENFEQSYEAKGLEMNDILQEMQEFLHKEYIELKNAGFHKTVDKNTDEGPEL